MGKRVPEKVRKTRKTPAKLGKADNRKKNVEIANRWYKYQYSWKKAEETLRKQRKEAKDQGTFFLEPEAKVALVVRVRGNSLLMFCLLCFVSLYIS